MKKFITMCVVAMLHLTLPHYSYSQQPPYQASIILKMPGTYANPIHLCNGAIIYEKLILTTADCMHFKFGINGKSNKLDASVISVIAGSANGRIDALHMNVSSIEIAPNFDAITFENDLALLVLSKSLPLGIRSDIKWIMLDDNSHLNRSCVVNFFSRNTKDAISDFYQTEEVYMVKNEVCRNLTKYPATRKHDICSSYVLPHQFDCAKANAFLSFNNDRGTGLVCKSFLVGLLSSVVTRPNPANNCLDVNLRAIYTDIYPHLRWIYSKMSTIETEYISTPYDASLNPLVVNSSPSANISNTFNSTSMGNSTTSLSNSTVSSFPLTNLTTSNEFLTNSSTTTVNSTRTNSTFVNSTVLNFATPNPLWINSTKWNATSTSNSVKNHTTKPVSFYNGTYTVPGPGHPYPKPSTQNIFKNSGVLVELSSGCFLIPVMVSLRLIGTYL